MFLRVREIGLILIVINYETYLINFMRTY